MEKVIEIDNISHSFGSREVLHGMNLEVFKGEVFGLLGPNGAGKTTTVRLLNGLYRPSSGRLRVLNLDPQTQGSEVRLRCGVLTETPALYERLSAYDNLRFFAVLAGMPEAHIRARVMELLEYFGLAGRSKDKAGTYSKGMKQRLALARALLTRPEVLFLDEPTSGLDPEAAQQVHELIAEICRDEGRTVFLCTHNLFEAQRLCSRLAVMDQGRLKAVGTMEELRGLVTPGLEVEIEALAPLPDGILVEMAALAGVEKATAVPNGLLARVAGREVIPVLVEKLVGKGLPVVRVEPRRASLEDIYFSLQNGEKEGQK